MKKSLLFASAAVLSVSFASSAAEMHTNNLNRSLSVNTQEIVSAKNMDTKTVYMSLAPKSSSRRLKGVQKMPPVTGVKYMRPRGSMFTDFTGEGGMYNFPFLLIPPFQNVTYTSVGAGNADNSEWLLQAYQDKSQVWYTGKGTSVEFQYTLETDSVPELAVGPNKYHINGYYKGDTDLATKENWVTVASVPNFTDYLTDGTQGVFYSTPAYIASQTRQRDDAGYKYAFTSIGVAGSPDEYWFGTNSKGINCVGLGLEKPVKPYIIKSACMLFMQAYVTEDTQLKATVYKVDSFDGDSVDTVLGDIIAEGTAILPAQGTATKGTAGTVIFNFKAKSDEGYEFAINPEINDNTVILVTGYDAPSVKKILIPLLNDEENECYIPGGYTGSVDTEGNPAEGKLTSLWGMFRDKDGNPSPMYNAPAIFVETEYPWLMFNYTEEANVRQFKNEGESYDLQLFSYKPSDEWNISYNGEDEEPSWLTLGITDSEQDGSFTGLSTVTLTAEALPEGVEGRSCHVVFSYPGAKLDYYVNQGKSGVNVVTSDDVKVVAANGNFEVSYPANVTSMKVYNVAGQLVKSVELNAVGSTTVNAQDLANGMYIVKFNNNFTTKVVK